MTVIEEEDPLTGQKKQTNEQNNNNKKVGRKILERYSRATTAADFSIVAFYWVFVPGFFFFWLFFFGLKMKTRCRSWDGSRSIFLEKKTIFLGWVKRGWNRLRWFRMGWNGLGWIRMSRFGLRSVRISLGLVKYGLILG